MPQVAFYTRISTDEDHQKYSLGAQKERLEAFCTSQYGNDWKLFRLYRDTDSGTHMNRDGLEEMLFDAEAQAFDTLLVFRVDRLSRKVRELAQMVDELTRCGVTLRSITEPFDTASAAGKMMLQMLGVFAEFEHATIVERTKMGMEKKAKGGEWVGGAVPYGYRHDTEKGLEIHIEEATIVKKMFKMYVFGREGAHTICRKLNESGHRKRSGKKWDKRMILHMLKNPLYIGKLRWRDSIYEGNHCTIISDPLFQKAQEIAQERVSDLNGRRWHNGDERLLTGRIKCARCRSGMVGVSTRKDRRKIPYYVCTKRTTTHDCQQDYVRADLLEAAIIADVSAVLRDDDLIEKIRNKVDLRLSSERPDVHKEIAEVQSQIARTEDRLNRYFEAFEAGTMDPQLCNTKIGALSSRVEELADEQRQLEMRSRRLALPVIERKAIAELLDRFKEVMDAGTNPQKKHLLHCLVKKVRVHDRGTIEVWYCLPQQTSVRTPVNLAPAVGLEPTTWWLTATRSAS